MKRYSILHVPVWSVFSVRLYRDVCHQWKGTGFAYLLLLLAVCWVPLMIKMQIGLSNFVDNEAPKIVSQIPAITIANGKASTREPQTYFIKDPETGKTVVMIDTTGSITALGDAGGAIGLVTATEATFRKNAFETRMFSFQEIVDFSLDQDRITGWLTNLKRYLAIGCYPFALVFSYMTRIVQVLIYAAIGLLFARMCRSRRSYVELLRLSVVAITPSIIVKTILGVASVNIPFAGLLYFVCTLALLFFGVKVSAHDEEAVPPALGDCRT